MKLHTQNVKWYRSCIVQCTGIQIYICGNRYVKYEQDRVTNDPTSAFIQNKYEITKKSIGENKTEKT